MTRQELELAHRRGRNLTAVIDEQSLMLIPKVFSTGSLGWHGQGKVSIDDTRCQLSIVVTVIGSKALPLSNGELPTLSPEAEAALGEQLGIAPKNAPEAPPTTSPLFPEENSAKKPRRRSKG